MNRLTLIHVVVLVLAVTTGAVQTAFAAEPTGQYLGTNNGGFYGWACAQGQQSPTTVELYLDTGPAQGGRPVAQTLANQPSGTYCNSSSVGWNLNITALGNLADGKHTLVFVALGTDGTRVLLGIIGQPTFYNFLGAIKGAITGINGSTLSGWACEVDNRTNNQVGLYLDVGPDQGGQPVATATANLAYGVAYCTTGPTDPLSNNNLNIGYQWNLSSLSQITGVHQLYVAGVSNAKGHSVPLMGSFQYDFSAATRSGYANRIDISSGVANMVLNNVATSGMGWGSLCARNRENGELDDMLNSTGFALTRMIFPLGDDVYHNCGEGVWPVSWDGGSNYNWSALDYELNRRLTANPQTKVILQVALDGAGGIIPDYLSSSWVSASQVALQTMVTHLNQTFPGVVVGYELFNGTSYDCDFPVDVSSQAAIARFRTFLTTKYKTDMALQQAWNQTGITLATAQPLIDQITYELPVGQDRTAMDELMPLVSPSTVQQYADSREFAYREKEQVIYNFADDIKLASGGQALVGVRSGEFPSTQWDDSAAFAFYTMDFYSYPSIDFYEIWEPYENSRKWGAEGGSGVPFSPPKGLTSLNKLFIVQNDFRVAYGGSSTVPSYALTLPPSWWDTNTGYGYDPTTAQSVQKLRRVFTNSIVNGTTLYLFELTDTYDQPYLLPANPMLTSEWKVQRDIASRAIKADRTSVAQVAYVMDPSFQKNFADYYDDYDCNPCYDGELPVDTPGPGFYIVQDAMQRWARAGVPFDVIFLNQIENTNYKVYVFFHTISLSADQVQRIQTVLSRNNAVGIFLDADGMADGNGSAGPPLLPQVPGQPVNPTPDIGGYISNLTGMQITGVMQPHTSKLQPTSFFLNNGGVQKYPDSWVNHTYRYWSPGYEVDFEVFPSFYVTPTSGVNPLAIFNENPYNRVAVAERPSPPGTNIRDIIYSALPYLPPDIIRYAVAKAGAQQYSDTEDHIFVDKSFVGFHTEAAGTITLTLPQASALHDVFSANTWPNNPCQPQTDYPSNSTQVIQVVANCTYLFFRGTSNQWAALEGQ